MEGEALRDFLEIVAICGAIGGGVWASIRRITKFEAIVENGFANNNKAHDALEKQGKKHGKRLRRVETDVAVLSKDRK